MLHELLVALRGHPGLVFTEQEGGRLGVNPSIDLLHPSETAILQQLLVLGSDYRELVRYTQQAATGMYSEAFCGGLDCVLAQYRAALTGMEKEILAGGVRIPLSQVQHRLLPHGPVLRCLVRLVRDLQTDPARGVMLLDKVYRAASTGVAGAAAALRTVLARGHRVMYKQLLAWLLQGELYDPHCEFFIVRETGEDSSLLVGETEGESQVQSKSGVYRLDYDMVPTQLGPQLADKIFFIGESVQLFESDRRVEVQGAVLREREAEFYQALARLRDKEEFVVSEFSQFVETVRESVSSHLHSLLVEECGLLAELRTVWDLFTMARGELFLAFIQLADRTLSQAPGPATQHEASQAWLGAVLSHTESEENLTGRAGVTVGRDTSKTGWQQIQLSLAVRWPLHLVVTPACLAQYNAVFSFLLLVRRTQAGLHQCWADNMFRARAGRRSQPASTDTPQQTRQHMTFLVDNLQYYLMADVLNTQVAVLTAKIESSTSFEEVRTFHDQFLSQVQASVFLYNAPVHKCLVQMLGCCLQFCASRDEAATAVLAAQFSKQSALLLQLLASISHSLAPTSLAQLLTRIDYNRFFSSMEKKNTEERGRVLNRN